MTNYKFLNSKVYNYNKDRLFLLNNTGRRLLKNMYKKQIKEL